MSRQNLNKWNKLKKQSGLNVLLLSCGLLWSFLAWGQEGGITWNDPPLAEPYTLWFDGPDGNARAGAIRLEWATQVATTARREPWLGEPFYLHLRMEHHANSGAQKLLGFFDIRLPEGLEVAQGEAVECLEKSDATENRWACIGGWGKCRCPESSFSENGRKIEVYINDVVPWVGGVPPKMDVMVRVPVIARKKPLLNDDNLKTNFYLKVDFEANWKSPGRTIRKEPAFHVPITVGGIVWDDDELQVQSTSHDSVQLGFLLYNWRNKGSVFFTLKDEHGASVYDKIDFRQVLGGPEETMKNRLYLKSHLGVAGLVPETNYRMQVHFRPDGVAEAVNSAWVDFRTTALPLFEVRLHAPESGQGSVDISPKETHYPLGTKIELTARPAAGWVLEHWFVNKERVVSENSLRLTVDKDLDILPSFVLSRNAPNGGNPNVTPKSGGCSQWPQNPSWTSLAALCMLALFFMRKKHSV